MDAELDPADAALLAAALRPPPATLDRAQLAARSGVAPAVLDALEREGFLAPVAGAPDHYTEDDLAAVVAGQQLLDAGLPLGELLDIARAFDAAVGPVADLTVERFLRFVRDPIHANSGSDADAAAALVLALERMLPATGAVVAHHFRRLLLRAAIERSS